MGTKKIKIQVLFLILFLLLTMCSYSQTSFTEELKWISIDSIEKQTFLDTTQVIEWGKSSSSLVSVYSKRYYIKNSDIFIMMVDRCSGIYCPSIYVFIKRNKFWHLITSSHAKLKEQIEMEVDKKQEGIVFKTKASQIGKLPFERLKLNDKE